MWERLSWSVLAQDLSRGCSSTVAGTGKRESWSSWGLGRNSLSLSLPPFPGHLRLSMWGLSLWASLSSSHTARPPQDSQAAYMEPEVFQNKYFREQGRKCFFFWLLSLGSHILSLLPYSLDPVRKACLNERSAKVTCKKSFCDRRRDDRHLENTICHIGVNRSTYICVYLYIHH